MAVTKAITDATRQSVRAILDRLIKAHFSGTLGTEPDISNIVMALINRESGFSNIRPGQHVWPTTKPLNTSARYLNSSVIKAALATGDPVIKYRVEDGLRAWGCMQSMGYNHVLGTFDGKCEIERVRPEFASRLCVKAGEDISVKMYGEANYENAILAGLIILESKWKALRPVANGFQVGKYVFDTRIIGTVSSYLGLAQKDTTSGDTPENYARSILYGKDYKIANGAVSPDVYQARTQTSTQIAKGPTTTPASGKNKTSTGCPEIAREVAVA